MLTDILNTCPAIRPGKVWLGWLRLKRNCEIENESMEGTSFVLVPAGEWKQLLAVQAEILKLLKEVNKPVTATHAVPPFITAMEFMQAVRIGRTKFDQLVAANKVKTLKRGRKIYVPVGEVERYFG